MHGLFMPQVAGWYRLPGDTAWFTVVECPRNDCEQRAKAYDVDGPWELWERPLPTGMLAQDVTTGERPVMEVLVEAWALYAALAAECPAHRPLPPFIRKALDEIYDRASEL